MNTLNRTCTAILALITGALPATANSACVNRTDMHALQTASLQQRLMVAAFTCHDTRAYNRFVLGHRGELQRSDATLLAYFKRNGGTAAYHTYKTRLANRSALESSRSDGFCGNANALFQEVSGGGSLAAMLDSMPTADTGRAACYMAAAKPVTGRSQRVVRSEEPAAERGDRDTGRRYARNSWDRDGGTFDEERDRSGDRRMRDGRDDWDDGPDEADDWSDRDDRYAWRGRDRDEPMYDDEDSDW